MAAKHEEKLFEIYICLRALVFHPQVDAHKGIGADDIGARIIGRTVPLQVP